MDFELVKTPTCEITGLPLPILHKEPEEVRALAISIANESDLRRPPDEHHHIHPKKDPILRSIGGKALRNSRIQKSSYVLHHYFYHQAFEGPDLDMTVDDTFELIVPAVAGAVPRQAIDFIGRAGDGTVEWRIVDMSDKQHAQVARATQVDQHKPIGRFLAEYATEQNIQAIMNDDSLIDRFLDNRTPQAEKRIIASEMLAYTLSYALKDHCLDDRHTESRDHGLFRDPQPKTFQWVTKRLIRIGHLDYFQNTVTDRLAAT